MTAALLSAYFAACNSAPGAGSQRPQAACTLNSDCATGNVCLFQICSPPCRTDVDCPAGSRCLETIAGAACVSATEAKCTADGCPGGTTCSEGACRTSCSGIGGCHADQTCAGAACVGSNPVHDPGTGGDGGGGANGTGGASALRDAGMGAGAPGSGGNRAITDAGTGGTASTGGAGGSEPRDASHSPGTDGGDASGKPCIRLLFPNLLTSTVDAATQLVSSGNSLAVSFQVLVDPDLCTVDDFNNSWDRVFIGFHNPITQAVQLVEVGLTGTDQVAATGHYEKNWTRENGTSTLGGGVGLPAWASDVRLSVNQVSGTTTIPWIVSLNIDLTQAQAELGTASLAATDFWYAIGIGTGHASSPVVSADVLEFEWPSGGGADIGQIETNGVQTAPALPTRWGKVEFGTGGLACE